jgi:hypothetical protein
MKRMSQSKRNEAGQSCISLRELYGDRYKIGSDLIAVTPSERKDPWMVTIPCRGGAVIYPYGGELLALELDYRTLLAKRVAAIPGVRLHQSGDGEHRWPNWSGPSGGLG